MWTTVGVAWYGMGSWRTESGVIRGWRANSGKGSHMGAILFDGDGIDVQEVRS